MNIAPLSPALALVASRAVAPALAAAPVAPAPAGSTTVSIDVAPGTMKFVQDRIEVPAGEVTFTSTNPDGTPHNIAVRGNGIEQIGEIVRDGAVSTVTVKLEKGQTYEFFCSLHESMGMKGTVVVV